MENKKQTKVLQCDFCDRAGTADNEVKVYSNEHDSGPVCDECVEHYAGKYGSESREEECCEEECD